jgi:hypothetical protein
METTLFKEPKRRLKDGRYCSEEQKRIEMSIERCKLLEMKLNAAERKAQALTDAAVMYEHMFEHKYNELETKYNELKRKIKELIN